MNIGATLITAGIVSLAPPLASPVSLLNVSFGGISIACGGEGCSLAAADTADFEVTAQLSSGSTVRVRL